MVGTNLQTFNVPGGEWLHECWLWNYSSLTLTVYLNGEMITSGTTDQRELRSGGTMCLGNIVGNKKSPYSFGGDLFKLNIFSRVLTETEVRNMASDICSSEEESLKSQLNKESQVGRDTITGEKWLCD